MFLHWCLGIWVWGAYSVGDNSQICLCSIDECFVSLFFVSFLVFWSLWPGVLAARKNSGPPGNLHLNWRLDFWQLLCSLVKD